MSSPPKQPDSEWEWDFELDPVYAWRISQLEHAGFESFKAFRLAVNDCDWRQAIHMLNDLGATQEQIMEVML